MSDEDYAFVVSMSNASGIVLIYACRRCMALIGWGPQDIEGAKRLHTEHHEQHDGRTE